MCSAQCHSSILQLPQLKEALGSHYLGEHLGESWFPLSLFFSFPHTVVPAESGLPVIQYVYPLPLFSSLECGMGGHSQILG